MFLHSKRYSHHICHTLNICSKDLEILDFIERELRCTHFDEFQSVSCYFPGVSDFATGVHFTETLLLGCYEYFLATGVYCRFCDFECIIWVNLGLEIDQILAICLHFVW